MITSGRSLVTSVVSVDIVAADVDTIVSSNASGTKAPTSGYVIRPGSARITPSALNEIAVDNGDGTFRVETSATDKTLLEFSGTIDYQTGAYSVTFSTAPGATTSFAAEEMAVPTALEGSAGDPNGYFKYLYASGSNSNDLPQMIVASNRGTAKEAGIVIQRLRKIAGVPTWETLPQTGSCRIAAGGTGKIYPVPGAFGTRTTGDAGTDRSQIDGYRIVAGLDSTASASSTVDCSLVFEISDNGQ